VLEELTGYTCDIDFQATVYSVISMRDQLIDTYWLNIADEAPFGALIEHTSFVSPDRYGGERLLYVARYIQSREEEVWQKDDNEVHRMWLDSIESLF
jgi:protoporphyrinogen oxidase